MLFQLKWSPSALQVRNSLRAAADKATQSRRRRGKTKSSKAEGLYKQVAKCLARLATNPRHPGLHTHVFHTMPHPTDPNGKVFVAYAQNNTPGAWRVLWCYGPGERDITVLVIEAHG
jgi:hypothetical protein